MRYMGHDGKTGPVRDTSEEAAKGYFNSYPKAKTCKVSTVTEIDGDLVIINYNTPSRGYLRAEVM